MNAIFLSCSQRTKEIKQERKKDRELCFQNKTKQLKLNATFFKLTPPPPPPLTFCASYIAEAALTAVRSLIQPRRRSNCAPVSLPVEFFQNATYMFSFFALLLLMIPIRLRPLQKQKPQKVNCCGEDALFCSNPRFSHQVYLAGCRSCGSSTT